MVTAPRLTLSEAERLTGRTRRTLRRWIEEGKIPGAERDHRGWWTIPAADLAALGHGTTPPDEAPRPAQGDLEALRAELAEYRRRAEVAEAVARERAEQITDLRRTVAALEAGPAGGYDLAQGDAEAPPDLDAPAEPVTVTARARRWWARRRS